MSVAAAFAPMLIGFVTYGLAIYRILSTRSTSGTSATSLVVSSVSCVAWAVWAWANSEPLLLWANLLWIPLLIVPELAAMLLVRPLYWGFWPLIPAWLVVCVICGVASLSASLDLLGIAVTLSGLLWMAPALREIFLRSDLTGVSASSWAISGISTLAWGLYGVLEGAWVPALYCAVQVAGIVAALARIAHVRRRSSVS